MIEQDFSQQSATDMFANIREAKEAKASYIKEMLGCDEVRWVVSMPVYFARKKDKWGIVSEEGVWLTPCQFDKYSEDDLSAGWVIPLMKESKWGFYTLDGLYVEPKFDDYGEDDDIVTVKLGDQWGLMDEEGKFVTKAEAEARDILPLRWWIEEPHPSLEQ